MDNKIFCIHCKMKVSRTVYYRSHNNRKCQTKKILLEPPNIHTEDDDNISLSINNENEIDFSSADEEITYECRLRENNDESYLSEEDGDMGYDYQDIPGESITEVWDEEEIPDFFVEAEEEENGESYRQVSYLLNGLVKWQLKFSISDGCLHALLKLIKVFLTAINLVINSNFLEEVLQIFPDTLYSLRRVTGINRDDFDQYIVCPDCHSLYSKDDVLINGPDGKQKAKRCTHVPFKHHPQKRFRTPCNAELLKTISNSTGTKENFYPKKVYCYRGIKRSFQEKLMRKGFLENLFSEPEFSSHYSDIYDGKYYSEFKDENGLPFFRDKRNIGLLVNFDFFNPFKKSKYSLGVLYAVIINLPRKVRFLWENVLVLGIIPGPREPKKHINTYLRPFVDELLKAWSPGMKLKEPDGIEAQYRFALYFLSCDLPAQRKIGGFLSHNAKQGCSKCTTSFLIDNKTENMRDIGSFNQSEWTPRDGEDHKSTGFELLQYNTLEKVKAEEKKTGVRYSELFRLPYHDPIRCHVIDPMHNLFLGVSKHVFTVWVETETLDKNKFDTINDRQEKLKIPSDVGRIAKSVCENYKTLKADEWKHWTMVYSIYCLKNLIPRRDLDIWSCFVRGCFLICRPVVTHENIEDAHQLFEKFCRDFEKRYDSSFLVPNFHMSLHIKKCLEDFGPVYAFWCFGFERYNGTMGSFHTNGHAVSVQLMRKFVTSSKLQEFDGKTEDEKVFDYTSILRILDSKVVNESSFDCSFEILKSSSRRATFTPEMIDQLREMFTFYCKFEGFKSVSPIGRSALRMQIGNQIFACNQYRGSSPYSYVFARWQDDAGFRFRPAVIKSIFEVQANVNGKIGKYWVASLDWFKDFEKTKGTEQEIEKANKKKFFYGKSSNITVWNTLFERDSQNSFVPMRCIKERFVYVKESLKFEDGFDTVVLAIKLPFNSFL